VPKEEYDMHDRAIDRALLVKAKYESKLLSMPHVVGVGVGFRSRNDVRTDQVCIVVVVDIKVPLALLLPPNRVPDELDGVCVDVQEVGQLRAIRSLSQLPRAPVTR
jgi:hypothetical protein